MCGGGERGKDEKHLAAPRSNGSITVHRGVEKMKRVQSRTLTCRISYRKNSGYCEGPADVHRWGVKLQMADGWVPFCCRILVR